MKNEAVIKYWQQYYTHEMLCSLCGNSGMIDTTETAYSPLGKRVGRVHYCICPNGQIRRDLDEETRPLA